MYAVLIKKPLVLKETSHTACKSSKLIIVSENSMLEILKPINYN